MQPTAVHRRVGGAGFLFIYIGGGVLAALDFWGKRTQFAGSIEKKLVVPDLGAYGVGFISNVANNIVHSVATTITPVLIQNWQFVGASAGICALAGFDVCVSVADVLGWLRYRYGRSPAAVLSQAARLYTTGTYIWGEWEARNAGGGGGGASVDHAGHTTGFAFGVGCFLLVKLAGASGGGGSYRPGRAARGSGSGPRPGYVVRTARRRDWGSGASGRSSSTST